MMFLWFLLIGILLYTLWNNTNVLDKKTRAKTILDERFSRGEISTAEYNQIKRKLEE